MGGEAIGKLLQSSRWEMVPESRMVECIDGKKWVNSRYVLEAELFLAAGRGTRMLSRVMPSFSA